MNSSYKLAGMQLLTSEGPSIYYVINSRGEGGRESIHFFLLSVISLASDKFYMPFTYLTANSLKSEHIHVSHKKPWSVRIFFPKLRKKREKKSKWKKKKLKHQPSIFTMSKKDGQILRQKVRQRISVISMFPEILNFRTYFVLKTTKTPLFVIITEIL